MCWLLLTKWSKYLGTVLEDFYGAIQLQYSRGRYLLHVARFWAIPGWGPWAQSGQRGKLLSLSWRGPGVGADPRAQGTAGKRVPVHFSRSLEAAPACWSFLPFSTHPKLPKGSGFFFKARATKDPEATALVGVGCGKGQLSPWD